MEELSKKQITAKQVFGHAFWVCLLISSLTYSQSSYAAQVSPSAYAGAFLQPPEPDTATSLEQISASEPYEQAIPEPASGWVSQVDTHYSIPDKENCQQLLVNSGIHGPIVNNILLIDPWVIRVPTIKFSNNNYVSPPYSLILWDADWLIGETDLTPNLDEFGQGFFIPQNLTYFEANYWIRTDFGNANDLALGEIWTLDSFGQPDERIVGWHLSEKRVGWENWYYADNNLTLLKQLEGKTAALVFKGVTDNQAPAEHVFLDDIYFRVCSQDQKTVHLPFVKYAGVRQPTCQPPRLGDKVDQNLGFTEVDAVCEDSLTAFDTRDYYRFVPQQTGLHTFHLQGLAQSSITILNDSPPTYPIPPNVNGGDCRTTTGGQNQSVRCHVVANQPYVIMIDLGEQNPGSYRMWVAR